jgi:hypothetical protein
LKGRDLESQAKCSKDAEAYFRREWPGGPGFSAQQTNHYNEAQNKCFVRIQRDCFLVEATGTRVMVFDVYENLQHAEYSEALQSGGMTMISCEVAGKKCQNIDEFNALASPLMNR